MLAVCGHKFGECSTDVHILRLCECHLAVANCIKFRNITIRFFQHFLLKIMYRVLIGRFYWQPRGTCFISSASCEGTRPAGKKAMQMGMCSLAWKWAAVHFIQTITVYFSLGNDALKRKAIPQLDYSDFSIAVLWHINTRKMWQLIKAGYEFFPVSLTWNTFWNNLLIPDVLLRTFFTRSQSKHGVHFGTIKLF